MEITKSFSMVIFHSHFLGINAYIQQHNHINACAYQEEEVVRQIGNQLDEHCKKGDASWKISKVRTYAAT